MREREKLRINWISQSIKMPRCRWTPRNKRFSLWIKYTCFYNLEGDQLLPSSVLCWCWCAPASCGEEGWAANYGEEKAFCNSQPDSTRFLKRKVKLASYGLPECTVLCREQRTKDVVSYRDAKQGKERLRLKFSAELSREKCERDISLLASYNGRWREEENTNVWKYRHDDVRTKDQRREWMSKTLIHCVETC